MDLRPVRRPSGHGFNRRKMEADRKARAGAEAATRRATDAQISCHSFRPNALFAELKRPSRTSIADEIREEHTGTFIFGLPAGG
jgi:hypothetical protein